MSEYILLAQILVGWMVIYIISKIIKLEERLPWIKVGPIYIVIKSEKLNRWLINWSERHRRILAKILDIGAISGYILMGIGFYLLTYNVINFFQTAGVAPTAKLIIPGVTISFTTLLKMLPAIVILLITHELAHKVAMHINNIEIKNMGLFLLYVIPGAFVEPDNDVFLSKPARSRMHVLGAGTFVNLLLGLLIMPVVTNPAIYTFMISPLYNGPSGVLVSDVIPNSALANQSQITVGDVILYINDTQIIDLNSLSKLNLKVGAVVIVKYLDRETMEINSILLKLGSDPNNKTRGILGFIPLTYFPPKYSWLDPYFPITLYEILFWIFFLGVNIAIFNIMPIMFLDGYSHLEALFDLLKVSPNTKKYFLSIIFGMTLSLVAINLMADYIKELIFR